MLALLGLAALAPPGRALAAECEARSGRERVPVLELYTSEGCSSCPPAERWLQSLPGRGLSAERLLALALHVDYWDRLGWVDRFASPAHAGRQREVVGRDRLRTLYTPQLVLDGHALAPGDSHPDIAARVDALARHGSRADLSLRVVTAGDAVRVTGEVRLADPGTAGANAYVGLYQDGLVSTVAAGENRGETLRHEGVVRALRGPLAVPRSGSLRLEERLPVPAEGDPARLVAFAFVEHGGTGEGLQSLTLPVCW